MKRMLVTYCKDFRLEFEVEANDFGDAKDKADALFSQMTDEERMKQAQEDHWEAVECEVIERG